MCHMALLPSTTTQKWYTTGGGIVALGIGGVILAIILLFAGFTGYYWLQIKQGKSVPPIIASKSGFTSLPSAASAAGQYVDPKKVFSATAPYWGTPGAPVVIVEFLDFKCPFCRASVATLRQLVQKYPKRVQLVVREFPIESLHPGANRLALMGYCAQEQNKFQPMHDFLYNEQNTIAANATNEDLATLATQIGFNHDEILACLNSPQALQSITKDYADGLSVGVVGTPTFFVNGQRVEGQQTLEWWSRYIDTLP